MDELLHDDLLSMSDDDMDTEDKEGTDDDEEFSNYSDEENN